jgi:hypothetical protein
LSLERRTFQSWGEAPDRVRAFGVWRLAFGVWRLGFGVGRWALGVWGALRRLHTPPATYAPEELYDSAQGFNPGNPHPQTRRPEGAKDDVGQIQPYCSEAGNDMS